MSNSNTKCAGVWVKATDRLGEFIQSDIPTWSFFYPDFCKVDGKPVGSSYFRKENDIITFVFPYLADFTKEIAQQEFNRVEWLDTSADPVKELVGCLKDMLFVYSKYACDNPEHDHYADHARETIQKYS